MGETTTVGTQAVLLWAHKKKVGFSGNKYIYTVSGTLTMEEKTDFKQTWAPNHQTDNSCQFVLWLNRCLVLPSSTSSSRWPLRVSVQRRWGREARLLPLIGCLLEEVGMGSAQHLFGQRTHWHELAVRRFRLISNLNKEGKMHWLKDVLKGVLTCMISTGPYPWPVLIEWYRQSGSYGSFKYIYKWNGKNLKLKNSNLGQNENNWFSSPYSINIGIVHYFHSLLECSFLLHINWMLDFFER